NSGTTAVYVALRACDIQPFTEVIVGPVTDPGGMMPIVMMNCIPVVADAKKDSFNVSLESIKERVTPY
ncbi:MAG TPA: glutamine--scyllo-inositol aminotransferase, partial [Clostridiales bacterium]|nr:glutamine--scyllo-inositol aminotransferase [Clostridiales bacterium]